MVVVVVMVVVWPCGWKPAAPGGDLGQKPKPSGGARFRRTSCGGGLRFDGGGPHVVGYGGLVVVVVVG